ncbi:MAG: hypothetical protein ACHQZS_03590 [Candidatus Binatales bacterium]
MAEGKGPEQHFSKAERSLLGRLSNLVAVTDVMAIMMVLATVLSAYATWRASRISSLLFLVSERPYIGVERLALERPDHGGARLVIDYRNFGHVQATETVLTAQVMVDGKEVGESDERGRIVRAGIISPQVPNHLYSYFADDLYQGILAGKSPVVVTLNVDYRGPAGEKFCDYERFTYDYRSAWFGSDGGSTDCGAH